MSTPSTLATRIRTLVQHRLTSLSRERRALLDGQEREVVSLLTDNLFQRKLLSCNYCRAKFLPCTGISGYYGCIFCISDHEECQWDPPAPEQRIAAPGEPVASIALVQPSDQNAIQFVVDNPGVSDNSSVYSDDSSSDSDDDEDSWTEEHLILLDSEANWTSVDSTDDEDYPSSTDVAESPDSYESSRSPSPCPFSVVEKAALQPIAFFMDPTMDTQHCLDAEHEELDVAMPGAPNLDVNDVLNISNSDPPDSVSTALFLDELSTARHDIPGTGVQHTYAQQRDSLSTFNLGPSFMDFPFDQFCQRSSSLSLTLRDVSPNFQPREGTLNTPRSISTLDSWATDYQGNGTLLSNQVDTLSQEPALFYGVSNDPFTPHFGVLQHDSQNLFYETGEKWMNGYNHLNTSDAFNSFNLLPFPPLASDYSAQT